MTAPCVDRVDVRTGLPSLTLYLDGQGVASRVEMTMVQLLRDRDVHIRRRVTVSVRSGLIHLTPNGLLTTHIADLIAAGIEQRMATL